MKKIYLLLALFLSNLLANAQGLTQLGEPFADDRGYDLLFAQDGGFVTSGLKGNNAVIYKTDCAGSLIAEIEKIYSPGPARFFDAVELPDGSIVAAGSATIATFSDTLERVLLLKTTSDLLEIATANYLIDGKAARIKSITLASNGNLLVLGEVTNTSIDFTNKFLLRVDQTSLLPVFDPAVYSNSPGVDVATQIIRTADGNCLMIGNSFSGNIFDPNAMIVNRLLVTKATQNGPVLWHRIYQDTFPAGYGLAHFGGVEQNPVTGNFTLCGATWSGSPGTGLDVTFFLLDNNGNLLDTALLSAPQRQNIYGIAQYSDIPGLCLAVGDSENPTLGTPNLLIAQAYDLSGELFQPTLINDLATPFSITDVASLSENRLAVIATIPDNPISLSSKDILVATPGIDGIEIVHQNCALTASFNAANPSYQWYLNNEPIPGATQGYYFPTESGVYQVRITDDIGCFGISDTLTVTLATANFDVATNNLTATFTNTSVSCNSYLWDFGDGQTSMDENPSHTYATEGIYTATLIGFSQCAFDTISQTIGLVGAGEPSWLSHFRLFPNPNEGIFSLEINGEPQSELTFSMFNPVGQVVGRQTFEFQTGSLQRTFDFGHLPPGVYTLQVLARGEAKYVKMVVAR